MATKMTSEAKKTGRILKKDFRILFIMIMLTWLILGIEVMVNSLGSQNTQRMSMQMDNNSFQVKSFLLKSEILKNEIEVLGKRIDNMSREMDLLIKNYLPPSLDKKDKEIDKDKVSSNEIEPNNQQLEFMSLETETLAFGLTDVSDRTAQLEADIYKVNEQLNQKTADNLSGNLILSAVRLRDAVREERNFTSELDRFKELIQNNDKLDENISILEKYAGGVASINSLRDEFNVVAEKIISTKRKQKSDATFFDKAISQFSSMVQIQKIKAEEGSNDTNDILARTYEYLLNNDLPNAVNEVNKLEPDAKNIANKWLHKTEASIESNRASNAIFNYVTNQRQATNNLNSDH